MAKLNSEVLEAFINKLDGMESDQFMAMVEQYLDDEDIDQFADFLEDFYGLEDDEEIGQLTQILIMGFMFAKNS